MSFDLSPRRRNGIGEESFQKLLLRTKDIPGGYATPWQQWKGDLWVKASRSGLWFPQYPTK
jgi:hypothetical protein